MDVIAFVLLRLDPCEHVVAFFWNRDDALAAAGMFAARTGIPYNVREVMCQVPADALDKVSRDLVVI